MKKKPHDLLRQNSLNTLAQNETKNIESLSAHCVIVQGRGTDMTNEKAMKGRAKRKTITESLLLNLVTITEQKEENERRQSYWNSYHCQRSIVSADGKLYGKYCKNRHCTLCCSIRKAKIVNTYLPIIQTWSEPYFVTLTVKSVKANILHKRIHKLNRGFARIVAKYRKRVQRGKGRKLMGVKSVECNFNPVAKTYNPHLHLIVPDEVTADILIEDWLCHLSPEFASPKAQSKLKVKNPETTLIEVVKYGSKIFTEPDAKRKNQYKKSDRDVYAAALDNIFAAMKGRRIFDRFGFNLPKAAIPKESKTQVLNEHEEWVFDLKHNDWVNLGTGEMLAGFIPTNELINLLQNCIDNVYE